MIRLKTLPSEEYGLEAATSSIISGSQTSNGRSDDYLKLNTAAAVETNWSVRDLFTSTDKDSKVPTTIHEEYTSGPLIMHKLDSLRQDLRMFFSKRNTSVPEISSKRDILVSEMSTNKSDIHPFVHSSFNYSMQTFGFVHLDVQST